jgi:hypothetical protein
VRCYSRNFFHSNLCPESPEIYLWRPENGDLKIAKVLEIKNTHLSSVARMSSRRQNLTHLAHTACMFFCGR